MVLHSDEKFDDKLKCRIGRARSFHASLPRGLSILQTTITQRLLINLMSRTRRSRLAKATSFLVYIRYVTLRNRFEPRFTPASRAKPLSRKTFGLFHALNAPKWPQLRSVDTRLVRRFAIAGCHPIGCRFGTL
jgi:hypothetical protein